MTPFIRHTGVAAWLADANVNTDTIIRINRFMMNPRKQLGPWAFEMLRYDASGAERSDFILNQPPYRGTSILIAGTNFGCGSSREAAVWAIAGRGIRVIIALSFGDIFRANCLKNGLLPITLAEAAHRDLLADWNQAAPGQIMTIDLEQCVVVTPTQRHIPFTLTASDRDPLLLGEDEITSTMQHAAAISAHFQTWQANHAWASRSAPAPGHMPRTLTPLHQKGTLE